MSDANSTRGNPTYDERDNKLAKLCVRGREIGKGGFGIVYEAIYKPAGAKICIKSANADNPRRRMALENESKVLQLCRSPYIPTWLGSGYEKNVKEMFGANVFNVYMELVPFGTIASRIKDFGSRSACAVPEPTAVAFTRDVLKGLAYLHSLGVVHGDIKPANCLIGHENVVLCDFGGSRLVSGEALCHPFYDAKGRKQVSLHTYTHGFSAPEVLLTGQQDIPCDIYAVGIMLVKMATDEAPGRSIADANSPAARIALFNYSDEAKDFVVSCLAQDPTARPSAEAALQHPWFRIFRHAEFPVTPRAGGPGVHGSPSSPTNRRSPEVASSSSAICLPNLFRRRKHRK